MEQPKNLPQTTTTTTSIALLQPNIICKQLFCINQLVPFPLSETQIEDWSSTLKRLAPNVTDQQLQTVLDKFATNRTKWNEKQGIQNIFRGLELLKLNKGEFYCEEKQMKYRNYCTSPESFIRIYENEKDF